MNLTQPLDIIPIWLVLPVTILLGLIFAEIGYRLGTWWYGRTPNATDPALGALVGASLGLLAFLLAFMTSAATDRFNARRALVVEDANSIGTTELRARYLPEPFNSESRILLKEYVDVRVKASLTGSLAPALVRSEEIQDELWQKVVTMVNQGATSDVYALYIDALNHMIDVNTERITAVESRVAPIVLLGVYFISMLGMLLVGFNNSAEKRRSGIALMVLVVMFAVVITLIIDLDRPAEGFLVVSQKPMLELQRQLSK